MSRIEGLKLGIGFRNGWSTPEKFVRITEYLESARTELTRPARKQARIYAYSYAVEISLLPKEEVRPLLQAVRREKGNNFARATRRCLHWGETYVSANCLTIENILNRM